jgi:hypothetical protein
MGDAEKLGEETVIPRNVGEDNTPAYVRHSIADALGLLSCQK